MCLLTGWQEVKVGRELALMSGDFNVKVERRMHSSTSRRCIGNINGNDKVASHRRHRHIHGEESHGATY